MRYTFTAAAPISALALTRNDGPVIVPAIIGPVLSFVLTLMKRQLRGHTANATVTGAEQVRFGNSRRDEENDRHESTAHQACRVDRLLRQRRLRQPDEAAHGMSGRRSDRDQYVVRGDPAAALRLVAGVRDLD